MPCYVKKTHKRAWTKARRSPTNGGKDKSANFEFNHDCTKFFKNGAYLHTIEVKNTSSGNPKVGSFTKERFIHFDLVIWKDTRETERNNGLLETKAKLLHPCRDF